MSTTYISPVIDKLVGGQMNKFAHGPAFSRRAREEIDGVPIEELVQKYGSPLYVFSEKTLRDKYARMHRAFATRYPNTAFAWSYKTNYLQAVCAVMHEEGSIAEVVSEMEYQMARSLNVPGEMIIFNGPYKSPEALMRAAKEGAMINVDHLEEIADLQDVARQLGRTLPVGIRLNLDCGIYPQWSRFGFNLETGHALEAVRRMAEEGLLRVNGLHCHIGTYILDPRAYEVQVEKMVCFAYEVQREFGFEIEYLDVGGGFPSASRLKNTYLPADVAVPPIEDYAEAITASLMRHLRPGHFPRLYIESGRALIDEAGLLITTVVATKRLPNGTRSYVVDAGLGNLFTSFWYKFTIETDRELASISEQSVIYGPLCMNIDVVDEGIMLPPLQKGMRLVISPVGAYNNSQSLQFIHYRPNVVMVSTDGVVELIREAEDLSDMQRRERLPKRLLTQQTNTTTWVD